ncbi:uroporphyrinogen-III synthase [Geminicoccus roseus]|uniref:uroporphyrinogen-III synthase n=1 Tax=Geminicoccus roseus TaxID=404900 RepID=UPI00041896FB|nr:uroporphyrinogen-III synthase [Geminicoccus roseus]
MRVLLTRPGEDSRRLADALAAQGHEVLVDPMLEIEPLAFARPDLSDVQAVLVTSRHAVPALASLGPLVPVFCVGEATAQRVKAAGAGTVVAGPGDAVGLAATVRDRLSPADGAVLHLAGTDIRPELRAVLEAHVFTYRRLSVYRARAAAQLKPATAAAVQAGRLDAVLLFSPRTAGVFAALTQGHDLRGIQALCLSRNVAEALDPGRFACVRIATRPDERALLDLLDAPAPG